MNQGSTTTGLLLTIGDAAVERGNDILKGEGDARPFFANVYAGSAGLAFFLAYLGELLDNAPSTTAADRLIRRLMQQRPPDRRISGGYVGSGALVYVCAHLGALWRDASLLDYAEELVHQSEKVAADHSAHDVIGGAAGAILALESLYTVRRSTTTAAAIDVLADRLLDLSVAQGIGRAWLFGRESAPAIGFAHGACGCAAALAVAYRITGNGRFLVAAEEALRFERSHFVADWSNWGREDARGTFPYANTSWCWGSLGMALGRLRMSNALAHPIQTEARAGLLATIAYGFIGKPQCLCHGLAGAIDGLREASALLGERWWGNAAGLQATRLETDLRQNGLCCEIYRGEVRNSPGLMTGQSGVGYCLLRSLDPVRVPCVLSLAVPPEWPPAREPAPGDTAHATV